MKKRKKYLVALIYNEGSIYGVRVYSIKWVSAWPKDPSKWGARFEVSPEKAEALKFGRDTALDIANTIRMRNAVAATVMVEEA